MAIIFNLSFALGSIKRKIYFLPKAIGRKARNFNPIVFVQSLSRVQLFATPWLQHARLPCPPLSLGVCLNSFLLIWWYPTISYSVVPFSSCPQSFPSSGYFLMSWLFASVGQSIWASASGSVPSMNIQDWFPLGITDLISLQSKGLLRVFFNTTVQKHPILHCSAFVTIQLPYLYMTIGKTKALTVWTFVGKVMSLFLICCLGGS